MSENKTSMQAMNLLAAADSYTKENPKAGKDLHAILKKYKKLEHALKNAIKWASVPDSISNEWKAAIDYDPLSE